MDFGFEGIGVDVIPTVTPNGDCIVPVNFWRDSQRRTILLVLEVSSDGENNHYALLMEIIITSCILGMRPLPIS